ncbi:hypothetical protein ABG768_014038 [Culter alburnus]|uniref:Transcription factor AP-2 C-terminal domain-containing protein n=1 Tax=Culter alburnus TaxID=194366 RepID=A0AAW1Z5V8_CULAL
MKSGGLHGRGIGRIGPYPLYMESFESLIENNEVSDEIMDALFHLFSRKRPDVLAINNQTLGHILEGDTRARSSYFTKFAEAILGGSGGYLMCSPIQEERERLGTLLFSSLGGFLVESVLKVSDSHQAKRYLVTSDELQRRCSPPESYSANTVVAYLRKAKGQKKKITETLAELEVNPSKRTKLTSQCSKLCEDECKDLAGDVMFLATKFIPQKRVGEALLEEGNVHAAIVKTEDCRKTLKDVKAALEKNWDTFDLATHGLGPAVINGTFSLIDACLKEKMRALKKKDSTDE